MVKGWNKHILLFMGLVVAASIFYMSDREVAAQTLAAASVGDASGCIASIEFSQRDIFGRTADETFYERFGAPAKGEFFATVNPEIPGTLSSLNDVKIYGVNNASGTDSCTLSLNGNACATFPGGFPVGGYVVSLKSCPNGLNDLNLEAYNTLKATCTQGGPVTITRVIYEAVWNSCA